MPTSRDATALQMGTHGPRIQWSNLAALLVFLILFIVWSSVALVIRSEYRSAIQNELDQNQNLASALTEQTVRVIAAIDQAMIRVADATAASRTVPNMGLIAGETGLAPNILVQLSLVDGDGRFRASNLDPTGEKNGFVDLSQREHVAVHLSPGRLNPPGGSPSVVGGLFIGKAVLGKVSGKWTIQISRKITSRDGDPLGVVVASLDPSYFEDVFKRVRLGRTGGVSLVGSDMAIRARVIGGVSTSMGESIGPTGPFAEVGGPKEAGVYQAKSLIDGVERIAAYRRVADYPLYLMVAVGKHEALDDWRDTRNVLLAVTTLFTLVAVTAAISLVIGLKRLERTNEALGRSERQAQQASQAKGEFLAAISHELRTPLTSIRGFAELMELRLDKPALREQAGIIRKAAEYLNDLLTEILDLSKLEAGAMILNSEHLEIRGFVRSIVGLFAMTAQGKGLTLEAHFAEALPERIECDEMRLRQILTNLLSNAVKFTEAGGIWLNVDIDTAAGQIVFQVKDTGPGIDIEVQQKIFERFSQGSARVSYEHGGTGLGLAISRGLAELMSGRLTLESSPGHGACFTLSLPSQPSPAGP